MAKQNFLSGGYYGKLGQTVGQRWKNIRTIRSYVIPRNPRTEAQQANRNSFASCVPYAQLGMQLNYKAECFSSSSLTEWNYRMKTATALKNAGLSELMLIPLYPASFTPPFVISSAGITNIIDETHIVVTVDGIELEEERVLTMLLLLPGTEEWTERLAVCIGRNSSSNYLEFTFEIPSGITLSSGMECRFISTDDTESATNLITSSQIELSYTEPDIHTFDTEVTSIERSGNTFTFTFAEPYNNGTNSIDIAYLTAVSNGAIISVSNPSVTLINNNGYFAFTVTCSESLSENLWAFPNGCELSISSISSVSSSVVATATNVIENLSSSDLSRSVSSVPSINADSGELAFEWAFGASLPTISETVEGSIYYAPQLVMKTDTLSNIRVANSSQKLVVTPNSGYDLPLAPSGSQFTLDDDLSVVVNGVTYTISANTFAFDSQNYVANSLLFSALDLSQDFFDTYIYVSPSGGTPLALSSVALSSTPIYIPLEDNGETDNLAVTSVHSNTYSGNELNILFAASNTENFETWSEAIVYDDTDVSLSLTIAGTSYSVAIPLLAGDEVSLSF